RTQTFLGDGHQVVAGDRDPDLGFWGRSVDGAGGDVGETIDGETHVEDGGQIGNFDADRTFFDGAVPLTLGVVEDALVQQFDPDQARVDAAHVPMMPHRRPFPEGSVEGGRASRFACDRGSGPGSVVRVSPLRGRPPVVSTRPRSVPSPRGPRSTTAWSSTRYVRTSMLPMASPSCPARRPWPRPRPCCGPTGRFPRSPRERICPRWDR